MTTVTKCSSKLTPVCKYSPCSTTTAFSVLRGAPGTIRDVVYFFKRKKSSSCATCNTQPEKLASGESPGPGWCYWADKGCFPWEPAIRNLLETPTFSPRGWLGTGLGSTAVITAPSCQSSSSVWALLSDTGSDLGVTWCGARSWTLVDLFQLGRYCDAVIHKITMSSSSADRQFKYISKSAPFPLMFQRL